MSQFRKGLRALFSLLIFLAVIEAGSTVYCRRNGIGNEFVETMASQEEQEEATVPHPYLGFTRRNRLEPVEAEVGIHPPAPIELLDFNERMSREPRKKDELVIAVFGNSVAERMFVFSGTYLADFAASLQKKIPALRKKKIRFLNMALFAYVQPQHMIASTLYSDLYDMAILIGGFNSVVHPLTAGQPLIFPLMQPEAFVGGGSMSLYSWLFAREALEDFSLVFLRTPLHYSSALLLAQRALYPHFQGRFQDKPETYANGGDPFSKEMAEQRVNIWSKSIVAQYGALRALGKPIWFFVQPNLHVPGSKPFTAEEEALRAQGTGFALGAKFGYPAMRAEAARLKREGVPIFDLSEIYLHTQDRVYADSCCHLQNRGVQIMLKEISDVVARDWRSNAIVAHKGVVDAPRVE